MAEKFEEIAVVVDQNALGSGIYDLTLKTKNIAKAAKAGQFVSVYSNDRSYTSAGELRRQFCHVYHPDACDHSGTVYSEGR